MIDSQGKTVFLYIDHKTHVYYLCYPCLLTYPYISQASKICENLRFFSQKMQNPSTKHQISTNGSFLLKGPFSCWKSRKSAEMKWRQIQIKWKKFSSSQKSKSILRLLSLGLKISSKVLSCMQSTCFTFKSIWSHKCFEKKLKSC